MSDGHCARRRLQWEEDGGLVLELGLDGNGVKINEEGGAGGGG
jgi:hypothetical protein